MKRVIAIVVLTVLIMSSSVFALVSFGKRRAAAETTAEPRLFGSDYILSVRRDGKYGYVDDCGEEILPCEYHYTEPFENGAGLVYEKEKECYFVGVDGKRLFDRTFIWGSPFDAAGRAVVCENEEAGNELIDKTGTTLFSAKIIASCGNGYYLYKNEEGKSGAVDLDGQLVLAPAYEYLSCFYRFDFNAYGNVHYTPVDRLLAGVKDEETGKTVLRMIDYAGTVLYSNDESIQFDNFYGDKTLVENGEGNYVVIDRDGNEIAAISGEVEVRTLNYLVVDVSDGTVEGPHDQYILYDWNGGILFDYRGSGYDPIFYFGTEEFVVRDHETGKRGLLNTKGETVIPCAYDLVGTFDANGYSVCREGDTFFVVDGEGQTVFSKTCDYLLSADHFGGMYYLACNRAGEGETYEFLDKTGETVKSFGSEYSFGNFSQVSGFPSFGIEYLCRYYDDGFIVVRDAESDTFVVLNEKLEFVSADGYDYLNLRVAYD